MTIFDFGLRKRAFPPKGAPIFSRLGLSGLRKNSQGKSGNPSNPKTPINNRQSAIGNRQSATCPPQLQRRRIVNLTPLGRSLDPSPQQPLAGSHLHVRKQPAAGSPSPLDFDSALNPHLTQPPRLSPWITIMEGLASSP
jgi:hypothetical protein